MFLWEIARALERIESRQEAVLERLKNLEGECAGKDDKWLQSGIDSILSYQAGKKKEAEE